MGQHRSELPRLDVSTPQSTIGTCKSPKDSMSDSVFVQEDPGVH